MQDQEVEAFGLTNTQLNILIATYYEDVGWISGNRDDRRGVTLEIKKLVDSDLVYITHLVREVSTVRSFGASGGLVKFVSSPPSAHCAIAITNEGRQLVEQINLSRRADACIVEGTIYVIRRFIGAVDVKDLPEFLSHKHQQLREEASKRLDSCLKSMPAEDLPEFLTDSDSVIRDTASGILAHAVGAEK